jgi:hypothetical protein
MVIWSLGATPPKAEERTTNGTAAAAKAPAARFRKTRRGVGFCGAILVPLGAMPQF